MELVRGEVDDGRSCRRRGRRYMDDVDYDGVGVAVYDAANGVDAVAVEP